MKRIVYCSLVGFIIAAFSCGVAWAQATAQISGTVRDQTGAVLPGAEVTATQTDTGVPRTTLSNETGSYVLPNLPVGPYRLEVGLPGFRTFVQSGIVLQVP
jgi:carboxypeptidase family protein